MPDVHRPGRGSPTPRRYSVRHVTRQAVAPRRASPMPRSSPPRFGRISPVLVLLLILVLPVAAILGTLYVVSVKRPMEQNAAENRERLMQVVGLRDPVKNRLDPRFADADGDLVADLPSDPTQLVDPPPLA